MSQWQHNKLRAHLSRDHHDRTQAVHPQAWHSGPSTTPCLRLDDVEQLVQVGENFDNHFILRQLHIRVVAVGAVVDDAVLMGERGGRGWERP